MPDTTTETSAPAPLSKHDLISNRALRKDDSDDFGYTAIAGRVAETVLALDPPLTVGLFGPWGSGKTSICELLRRELARKDASARLVYYDASTYGGEALKRNFISHVAAELGYDATKHPEFHQGLYESSRRTEIDFAAIRKKIWPTLLTIVLLWFGFLVVFCLLAGITSIGTDENFLGQIGETLPQLIAPTAVGGLVIAVAGLVVKGATLDAEQSRPASDEAFARCFRDLIEKGRRDRKFKRLVIFVDELDRCSSEDVVTTLTAIRTFLTQDHAVFVVAADRAALERALEEKLPQPTPVNEEEPYYSSASSFFDKIFHDRVPLPPLRGPRLYEWAYEQVVTRGGYWAKLREGSSRELRDLLYFLIPSHVRAPRRVKVLLNGFIRGIAIAAHAGFDWRSRASEIAKLTVLDTEFPALGSDLRIEPRLPELLLDPPASPSERVARLLSKYGGVPAGPDGGDPDAETPSDQILADVTTSQREVLVGVEHEQLRRYLARTSQVRIGKDLLFLDPAGAALGLEDPELEALLDQAVDEPGAVVAALGESDTETRRLSARFLADMAEREFGEERRNVIGALMGVIELLDEEVAPVAAEIAGSIQSYARDESLGEDDLMGALIVSLAPGVNPDFRSQILSDGRLLVDPDRLGRIGRVIGQIGQKDRDRVDQALADRVVEEPDDFFSALGEIPASAIPEILRARPVYDALWKRLRPVEPEEEDEGDEFAEKLYGLAEPDEDDGPRIRRAVHDMLLRENIRYGPLKAHASEVLGAIETGEDRDGEILECLRTYKFKDPDFWLGQLSDRDYESAARGDLAMRVVDEVVSGIQGKAPGVAEVDFRIAEAVVGFAAMAGEDSRAKAVDTCLGELPANEWWSGEPARIGQQRLHALIRELADDRGPLEEKAGPPLAADLARALAEPALVTEEAWKGIHHMGGLLGSDASAVFVALEPFGPDGGEWPMWVTRVRIRLARAARAGGADMDAGAVATTSVRSLAQERGEQTSEALEEWFALDPPTDDVLTVTEAVRNPPPQRVVSAFERWAKNSGLAARTALAIDFLDSGLEGSRFFEALMQVGVEEVRLVERIAEEVRSAARGSRREELMISLARSRPLDPRAQRAVADLIVELVGTGKQIDFKAAMRGIPALGQEHRSATRLRAAFQEAAEEHGHQLPEREAVQLAETGVKIPKKAVKKGAWSRVKSLVGR